MVKGIENMMQLIFGGKANWLLVVSGKKEELVVVVVKIAARVVAIKTSRLKLHKPLVLLVKWLGSLLGEPEGSFQVLITALAYLLTGGAEA